MHAIVQRGRCFLAHVCLDLPSLESPELEAVVTSPYEGDLRPILLQLEGAPGPLLSHVRRTGWAGIRRTGWGLDQTNGLGWVRCAADVLHFAVIFLFFFIFSFYYFDFPDISLRRFYLPFQSVYHSFTSSNFPNAPIIFSN